MVVLGTITHSLCNDRDTRQLSCIVFVFVFFFCQVYYWSGFNPKNMQPSITMYFSHSLFTLFAYFFLLVLHNTSTLIYKINPALLLLKGRPVLEGGGGGGKKKTYPKLLSLCLFDWFGLYFWLCSCWFLCYVLVLVVLALVCLLICVFV